MADYEIRRRSKQQRSSGKAEKTEIINQHQEKVWTKVFLGLLTVSVLAAVYAVTVSHWMFASNNDLQKGVRYYENLIGPESFSLGKDGEIYTGLMNGSIVRITLDKDGNLGASDSVTFLGNVPVSKRKKTRPLGVKYHNKKLYIADAYQGVFSLDLLTNTFQKIVRYDDIEPHIWFTNGIDVSADGSTLYFTDLSQKWNLDEIPNSLKDTECSGRLLRFDFKTKQVQTIRDKICSANGVLLSPDESKILISEIIMSRLMVYDLKESKVSKVILLPGAPDNIRPLKDGGYLVGLPMVSKLPMEEYLSYIPGARNLIRRAIQSITQVYLNEASQGTVAVLDENFNIARVLYDTDGRVARAISEAIELDNGDWIIGSYNEPGILQIKN